MSGRVKRFWLAFCGILFVLLVLYRFSPFYVTKLNLQNMNASPSWLHMLGTDSLGRDMASRISMAYLETVLPVLGIASLAMLGSGLTALFVFSYPKLRYVRLGFSALGILITALPLTILVFALLSLELASPWFMILLVIAVCVFFKTFYDLGLLLRRDENLAYWEAHQTLGGQAMQRLWSYGIKRGWIEEILTLWANYLRLGIIIEASLSYLGFGVSEPKASLGNMLSLHFSKFIHGNTWTIVILSLSVLIAFGVIDLGRLLLQHLFLDGVKNHALQQSQAGSTLQ